MSFSFEMEYIFALKWDDKILAHFSDKDGLLDITHILHGSSDVNVCIKNWIGSDGRFIASDDINDWNNE